MTTHCLNCGRENKNTKVLRDGIGPHAVCPECGASYPVEPQKYTVRFYEVWESDTVHVYAFDEQEAAQHAYDMRFDFLKSTLSQIDDYMEVDGKTMEINV